MRAYEGSPLASKMDINNVKEDINNHSYLHNDVVKMSNLMM